MDLGDTNISQQNYVRMHCSNFPHNEATFIKQSTDEDDYHNSQLTPPQPLNRKRQLSCDDDDIDLSAPKKSKANDTYHRIAIIIPIMVKRLRHNIANYNHWRGNGFDVVLVYNEDEEGAVTGILHQYASDMKISFATRLYITSIPPNAGIAKHKAYCIQKEYLDRPDFQFSLLLDDTVNDIINTCTEKSIMTTPNKFYDAVKRLAEESPIFGGTVAYKRHPKKCKQEGITTVNGSFLQQALIFSCRGTPTLEKHFEDVNDEYIATMRELCYRKVPFGEDVAFQLSLYEHGLLSKEKSPQFWGIGISRIPHKSSTKPAFDQLKDDIKEEMREMLIYLDKQNALSINPQINELRGVRVIPGGPIRIRIKGRKGERPWREAFKYTFQCSKENNKDLVN